jgi:hypothetical protein
MIDFSDGGIIHTIDEVKDKNGVEWFVINGNTYYRQKDWLKADAIADFQSPESIHKRAEDEYRIWCD